MKRKNVLHLLYQYLIHVIVEPEKVQLKDSQCISAILDSIHKYI